MPHQGFGRVFLTFLNVIASMRLSCALLRVPLLLRSAAATRMWRARGNLQCTNGSLARARPHTVPPRTQRRTSCTAWPCAKRAAAAATTTTTKTRTTTTTTHTTHPRTTQRHDNQPNQQPAQPEQPHTRPPTQPTGTPTKQNQHHTTAEPPADTLAQLPHTPPLLLTLR